MNVLWRSAILFWTEKQRNFRRRCEEYHRLMEKAAKSYVEKIFAELKAHSYNTNLKKLYVMGRGAKVVELVGNCDPDNVTFNHDIRANAKGYEYFCYMKLRRQKATASAG